MPESVVQVAPDSTGKRIRNFSVTEPVAAGTLSASIANGANVSALPLDAGLTVALVSGDVVQVDGNDSYTVAAAGAAVGAVSIPVTPRSASSAHVLHAPVTFSAVVYQQAVVMVGSDGSLVAVDAAGHVGIGSLPAKQLLSDAGTISANGDNVIHDTTAGKTLQVYYLKLSADAGNGAAVTATTRIGEETPMTTALVDKSSLAASQMMAVNIGAEFGGGQAYVAGGVAEDLIVNLSAAQTVHWTLRYLEAP